RLLGLAAREADIINLAVRTGTDGRMDPRSGTAAATAEKVGWIRDAAGPRFARIELSSHTAFDWLKVGPSPLQEARHVAADLEARFGPGAMSVEAVLESPLIFIGTVPDLV